MSAQKVASAVRSRIDRHAQEARTLMQLGRVSEVDPWKIELLETRATLFDDEITLTQWVRRYHVVDTIDVGDTVLVLRKQTGGEIHWVVCDVLSDKIPS